MVKYTETELIQLRQTAVVPSSVDFSEFAKAVGEQREVQAQTEPEIATGQRRLSHQGGRPKFNKYRQKKIHEAPQPDSDGWVTLNKKKSFGNEEASSREKFRESVKDTAIKVRPNNKNISSSKPADPRDITSEQSKATFNAFAALGDEDEDDEDEDEDDEDEE